MAVMRWDPFRQFDRLTEQLQSAARAPRAMPMEAYRRGDQFFVHLDLPGVSPEDVELTVERNVLSVRAERRPMWTEGDDILIDETPQGVFSRQLFLGENLDAENLEATYDRGMLTLTIPVAEQAKPRRIDIQGASEPQPVSTSTGEKTGKNKGKAKS